MVMVQNLPSQSTSFIGRRTELKDIAELLMNPECRLLTLVGPGGIGKTRLAIESAIRLPASAFPDGVYYVTLAALDSATDLPRTVAHSLQLDVSDSAGYDERLVDYLSGKHLLLVFDNYEHLLPDVTLLNQILRSAPDVSLLVTSRAVLGMRLERVFQVNGLQYPCYGEAGSNVSECDAVRLFIERAQYAQTDFSAKCELENVVQITKIVEGMPLALELAASWVRTLSCPSIEHELRTNLDVLATRMRDVPDRHHTIRAVFDQSWDMLAPQEQIAFSRLSVFSGGLEREAAEYVAGATLDNLAALVDHSFLRREADGRFHIHELLRQYGAEHLSGMGQTAQTRTLHSAYYADFMERREVDIKGLRQLSALAEIDADYDNVQIAWEWAVEQRNWDVLDRMLETLYQFTRMRRNNRGSLELLKYAKLQLDSGDSAQPHPVWNRLLARWGELRFVYGDPYEGHQLLQDALAIAQEHSNREEIAFCRLVLAPTKTKAFDFDKQMAMFEASLAYFQDTKDDFNTARVLFEMANTRWFHDGARMGEARDLMQQSLELRRKIGDQIGVGWSLYGIGYLASVTGNYLDAEKNVRQAIAINREMGIQDSSMESELSIIAFVKGDFIEARSLAEKALDAARITGHGMSHARLTQNLFNVAVVEGDVTEANKWLEERNAMPRLPGEKWRYFDFIKPIFESRMTDYSDAKPHVRDLLQARLSEYGTSLILTNIQRLPFATIYLAHDGHQEWAVELLALAFAQPENYNGWMKRWNLLLLLRDKLEESLGEAKFAAAWERGQTGDLKRAAQALLDYFAREQSKLAHRTNPSLENMFTSRELDVVDWLVAGYANREIADRLTLAEGTVKKHLHHIYSKLGVAKRADAIECIQSLTGDRSGVRTETGAPLDSENPTLSDPLTSREQTVLRLVAADCSSEEISLELSISLGTVKNHIHNICGKLEVRNRHEAVECAQANQIL